MEKREPITKTAKINALHNKLGEYGRIEVSGKDLLPYVGRVVKISIEV